MRDLAEARGWAAPDRLVLGGAAILALLYAWFYLGDPFLPGTRPERPLGWWSWSDQGHYLRSLRALSRGDLSPTEHWYPLGYALLGAPFHGWSRMHPFFWVNLAALLACYAGFLAFARRLGFGAGWAVALFLGSLLWDPIFLRQWTIPWNSSPAAALIWLLLAAVAAHMAGTRRPFVIGLLAAAIPLFRPTEALVAALCVLAALLSDLRDRPARPWRDLLLLAAGGLVVAVPAAALHLAIHGPAPSEYMLVSRRIGMTLHGWGWKAYTLLLDPLPWFPEGEGLLRRAPWAAPALGGMAVAWAHGRAAILLAAALAAHLVLYVAYVDLVPTGLWRFFNVHYFKWALPGLALLAALLVRDLWRWRRAPAFPLAPVALAVSLPLLCLQVVPRRAADDEPARMLVFPGPPPDFESTYFGNHVLRDATGERPNVLSIRALPAADGLRVLAIGAAVRGPTSWVTPPPGVGDGPPRRYAEEFRLGLPCWLPGLRCAR